MRRHRDPDTLAERDHMRESDGALAINGVALGIKGRCVCGIPMYTNAEVEQLRCVGCQTRLARCA